MSDCTVTEVVQLSYCSSHAMTDMWTFVLLGSACAALAQYWLLFSRWSRRWSASVMHGSGQKSLCVCEYVHMLVGKGELSVLHFLSDFISGIL